MKRFYCTDKKGQVTTESETTIIDTDERVKNFFEPTPKGHTKDFDADGLPFNKLIPIIEKTAEELEQEQNNIFNSQVFYKIAQIELKLIRPIKELLLDANNADAKIYFDKYNEEIELLKATLK